MSTHAGVELIIEAFENNADPERGQQMKSYMKDHFEFYGIPSARRKELAKEGVNAIKKEDDCFPIIRQLYELPQRELHYVAIETYYKCRNNWSENALKEIEWLIQTNSWWDTVDFLASNCAGYLLNTGKLNISKIAKSWNTGENLWLKRTSLLFQLKYKEKTNRELLSELILPHIDDKTFFIKKAIGWALRQYSKTNPDWVRAFVGKIYLQPLSTKEALKHIR